MSAFTRFLASVLVMLTVGATPLKRLDSQVVLHRYTSTLLQLHEPKTMIFSYTVSQAGPTNIDQTHRLYRSGDLVRDETLDINGLTVHPKITRIARYRNRYTVTALAPRETEYAFLFERVIRTPHDLEYRYKAVPLAPPGAFVVREVTIDGRTYLPSAIRFRSSAAGMSGSGTVIFERVGKYWVPGTVGLRARLNGKAARERITFSGYQFPARLPRSTFSSPKPLPTPVLPTF